MGEIASGIPIVFVLMTTPNEEPQKIRDEILKAVPHGQSISGRAEAIQHAVQSMSPEDTLVICGKDTSLQLIHNQLIPFNDRIVALRALKKEEASWGDWGLSFKQILKFWVISVTSEAFLDWFDYANSRFNDKNQALWTPDELYALLGHSSPAINKTVAYVTHDTRLLKPESLCTGR